MILFLSQEENKSVSTVQTDKKRILYYFTGRIQNPGDKIILSDSLNKPLAELAMVENNQFTIQYLNTKKEPISIRKSSLLLIEYFDIRDYHIRSIGNIGTGTITFYLNINQIAKVNSVYESQHTIHELYLDNNQKKYLVPIILTTLLFTSRKPSNFTLPIIRTVQPDLS